MKPNLLLQTLLILVLLTSPAIAVTDSALDLSTVITEVALHRQDSVRFVEEKHFSFLDQPLLSKGILHYQPPDGLIREMLEPEKRTIHIKGEHLTVINDAGKERSVNLQNHPHAKIFVATFLATILGNAESIEKLFHGTVTGSKKRWTINLVPRDESIRYLITGIIIRGRGYRIESIETKESGGDYSLMSLSYDAP